MSGKLMYLLLAMIAGATMAVQGTFNSVLGKIIGMLEASLIVHVVGSVIIFALIFVFRLGSGHLTALTAAPWYTLLGGALSVIIIYGVALSISQLGVAITTTGIIVGQVLFAVLIDHFGLFGTDKICGSWQQFLGLVLLAAGAKLLLR